MATAEQAPKVKLALDDIEIVNDKTAYLKISSPSVVESVRALRKAAGLDPSGTFGAASGTG